jgi:threonine dehydrogenase-like Zn-dependent dehydrogenase
VIAAVTTAEHGFDVVDLPDPAPGAEELVIRVAACGVCGSDVKAADLPSIFAALVEPFAVGLHGVDSANMSPDDDVLIVGAGGVGLTTLAWALQKGGARVTVADTHAGRRETALAIGATDVLAAVSEAETGGMTRRLSAWAGQNLSKPVSRRYARRGVS